MAQRCKVCVHPKREAINKELLQPTTTMAILADRYGMSSSALDRHKANHLRVSAGLVSEAKNALTIVGYAADLYERATGVLDRAEQLLAGRDMDSRSVQAAAASLREVRGSIELLAKLVVSTPDAPPEHENSWLDAELTEAIQSMRLPELPAGHQLESDVAEAVIVQAPD